jgi:hypothetical protein
MRSVWTTKQSLTCRPEGPLMWIPDMRPVFIYGNDPKRSFPRLRRASPKAPRLQIYFLRTDPFDVSGSSCC